jgi:hypothetical protein
MIRTSPISIQSQRLFPWLGFDDGQFVCAIDENVIRGERLAAPPMTLKTAKRDRVFAPDAADLGRPEEISKVFVGFQKFLYHEAHVSDTISMQRIF